MAKSTKNLRILKLYNKGVGIIDIARKIGTPQDVKGVIEGLREMGVMETHEMNELLKENKSTKISRSLTPEEQEKSK